MSELKNESAFMSDKPTAPENDSLLGVFVGMFWMLWGNIFVAAMAIKIVQKQASLSVYDIFYWVFVVLLALTRFCDIRYFRRFTLKGSPATMMHWRKYFKYLLFVSVGLWILAHVVTRA